MSKVEYIFSNFVNIALKILFVFVVLTVIDALDYYYEADLNSNNLIIAGAVAALGGVVYLAIKKGVNKTKILIGILIFSCTIRMAWILSINSVPSSDFKAIYDGAGLMLEGDYHLFGGSNYFARFPHLTVIVVYFAAVRHFFSEPLIVMKIINVICSTADVLLAYLIVKEVFESKIKGIWAGYVASIYPPLVIYTAVYCGENIAIPFFMLSTYIFILVVKYKKPVLFLILSGIFLSVGNFFRMVAPVMVVAFAMYLVIYYSKDLKVKASAVAIIIVGFLLPLISVNFILKSSGITEYNLWKGKESSWTSILKGTNLESHGRYNVEDAIIPDQYNHDYQTVEQVCKEIVKQRLTETPINELVEFYKRKFVYQWREGDFGAIFWSELNITEDDMIVDLYKVTTTYNQFIYFILISTTYLGLFIKKQYLKNPAINLFYIIYCGYALLFLITESQDRYSFIVSWLFIILPFAFINVGEEE